MTTSTPEPWVGVVRQLSSDAMWTRVELISATGSTNADVAAGAARADDSLPDGYVLVALRQDAGRGRFDRRWESPAGASLAISALVAPTRPTREWMWLSVAAGMAVRSGVARATGADEGRVTLKWPNDVLLDGLKVCGILVEQVTTPRGPRAVIGIGVNVSLTREQLPVENATSLALAGLRAADEDLVAAILVEFQELFMRWKTSGTLADDYRRVLSTLGRPVRVILAPGRVVQGTAVDVDEFGQIVVEVAPGERHAYAAGDVVHLR